MLCANCGRISLERATIRTLFSFQGPKGTPPDKATRGLQPLEAQSRLSRFPKAKRILPQTRGSVKSSYKRFLLFGGSLSPAIGRNAPQAPHSPHISPIGAFTVPLPIAALLITHRRPRTNPCASGVRWAAQTSTGSGSRRLRTAGPARPRTASPLPPCHRHVLRSGDMNLICGSQLSDSASQVRAIRWQRENVV